VVPEYATNLLEVLLGVPSSDPPSSLVNDDTSSTENTNDIV
jgi:hypothetical protein